MFARLGAPERAILVLAQQAQITGTVALGQPGAMIDILAPDLGFAELLAHFAPSCVTQCAPFNLRWLSLVPIILTPKISSHKSVFSVCFVSVQKFPDVLLSHVIAAHEALQDKPKSVPAAENSAEERTENRQKTIDVQIHFNEQSALLH